jgi:hypothetical protein
MCAEAVPCVRVVRFSSACFAVSSDMRRARNQGQTSAYATYRQIDNVKTIPTAAASELFMRPAPKNEEMFWVSRSKKRSKYTSPKGNLSLSSEDDRTLTDLLRVASCGQLYR